MRYTANNPAHYWRFSQLDEDLDVSGGCHGPRITMSAVPVTLSVAIPSRGSAANHLIYTDNSDFTSSFFIKKTNHRYDRAYSDDGHLSKAIMKFYADYDEYSSAYSNVVSPGRIFDYENDTAWLNDWSSSSRGHKPIDWKNVNIGSDSSEGPHVDVYEKCPFKATEENVKARCVHEYLISGQGESGSDGDGQQDGKCGDNGNLTAIESRVINPTSVCSWEHLEDGDPHSMFRWCCCKDGDCFAEVISACTHARTHARTVMHACTFHNNQLLQQHSNNSYSNNSHS